MTVDVGSPKNNVLELQRLSSLFQVTNRGKLIPDYSLIYCMQDFSFIFDGCTIAFMTTSFEKDFVVNADVLAKTLQYKFTDKAHLTIDENSLTIKDKKFKAVVDIKETTLIASLIDKFDKLFSAESPDLPVSNDIFSLTHLGISVPVNDEISGVYNDKVIIYKDKLVTTNKYCISIDDNLKMLGTIETDNLILFPFSSLVMLADMKKAIPDISSVTATIYNNTILFKLFCEKDFVGGIITEFESKSIDCEIGFDCARIISYIEMLSDAGAKVRFSITDDFITSMSYIRGIHESIASLAKSISKAVVMNAKDNQLVISVEGENKEGVELSLSEDLNEEFKFEMNLDLFSSALPHIKIWNTVTVDINNKLLFFHVSDTVYPVCFFAVN